MSTAFFPKVKLQFLQIRHTHMHKDRTIYERHNVSALVEERERRSGLEKHGTSNQNMTWRSELDLRGDESSS